MAQVDESSKKGASGVVDLAAIATTPLRQGASQHSQVHLRGTSSPHFAPQTGAGALSRGSATQPDRLFLTPQTA